MNLNEINNSLDMINYWYQTGYINSNHTVEIEIAEYKKKDILKILGTYKKINKNDDIIKSDCSICNNNFKCNEYKRILPKCKHIFHKKCIDKIIINQFKCPICLVSIM